MYGYIFWFTICFSTACMPPVPDIDPASDQKNSSKEEKEDIPNNEQNIQRERAMRVLHYVYAYPFAIESRKLPRRRQFFKIDGD